MADDADLKTLPLDALHSGPHSARMIRTLPAMTKTNQAIKPWVQRLCTTPLGPVRLLAGPDGLAGLSGILDRLAPD